MLGGPFVFSGAFACVRVGCVGLFVGVLRYLGVGRVGCVLWCWGCPLGGPLFLCLVVWSGCSRMAPFVVWGWWLERGSAGDGWILAAAPRESTRGGGEAR